MNIETDVEFATGLDEFLGYPARCRVPEADWVEHAKHLKSCILDFVKFMKSASLSFGEPTIKCTRNDRSTTLLFHKSHPGIAILLDAKLVGNGHTYSFRSLDDLFPFKVRKKNLVGGSFCGLYTSRIRGVRSSTRLCEYVHNYLQPNIDIILDEFLKYKTQITEQFSKYAGTYLSTNKKVKRAKVVRKMVKMLGDLPGVQNMPVEALKYFINTTVKDHKLMRGVIMDLVCARSSLILLNDSDIEEIHDLLCVNAISKG